MRRLVFLPALLLIYSWGCNPVATPPKDEALAVLVPGSGTYTRPISTDSKPAQKFFDQGLRLTWGYHFPEAVASHQEALRHDPDHPMLYWGLALALGPNPNSRFSGLPDDPQGEAFKAIRRAMQVIDKGNEKERSFVQTLYTRFDSKTFPDRDSRDQAYLRAAQALHERYPDDPDAGTLLGDAYMITRPGRFYWDGEGRPLQGTADAARVLERVMEMRPDHPGGNHLYLHLFESSKTPQRALAAADRLAPLMPGVGHVVHMPSHIYVRLGQHSKAIQFNLRSAQADREFLEAWGHHSFPQTGTYLLSAQNHRRHAYDFIRYSAAIQGNFGAAIQAAQDALLHEPEARIRRGAADRTIAARWLIHKMFGRWKELLAQEYESQGKLYLDGMWSYTQGSARVGLGDLQQARAYLLHLKAVAADPDSATIRASMNPVSTLMELAWKGLEGEIKQAEGDLDGAIAAFRDCVDLQDRLAYTEPPDWPQPMRHYLGAALLEAGDAPQAEQEYRRDLESNPNDGWSLFGLWQSLQAQGKTGPAATVLQAQQAAWQQADVQLTRSRF